MATGVDWSGTNGAAGNTQIDLLIKYKNNGTLLDDLPSASFVVQQHDDGLAAAVRLEPAYNCPTCGRHYSASRTSSRVDFACGDPVHTITEFKVRESTAGQTWQTVPVTPELPLPCGLKVKAV